jgi:hypothetical protein
LEFHSGREADHSPPSSAEVEEWVELYLHPNTPLWRGDQLGEHRDNILDISKNYSNNICKFLSDPALLYTIRPLHFNEIYKIRLDLRKRIYIGSTVHKTKFNRNPFSSFGYETCGRTDG